MRYAADCTEDVYGLIHSLSAVERAFFIKLASGKAQSLHLRLFELVANGTIKDDTSARQALKLNSSAQFSNLKNHLSSELQDAVTFLAKEDSADMRHHFGMMELSLLLRRHNYYLAKRVYKKLWNEAAACGKYAWMLQLLQCRNLLFEQSPPKLVIAEANKTTHDIEQFTAYEHTDSALAMLSERLVRLKADTSLRFLPQQLKDVDVILTILLPLKKSALATGHLHLRFLAVHGDTAYLMQQFESCDLIVDEAVSLLQAQPELIDCNPEPYLKIANTSFYNAFAAGNVTRASALLNIFSTLSQAFDGDEPLRRRWSIIQFNTALKIAHKTANYAEVKELMHKRGEVIAHAREVLPQSDELSVMASICISLFVLEEFAAAEDLLLEIKELNRSLDREDLLYFSLVFHLLILYEQKDWYRLDSATEAAYHMLYSRKKLRPFEKELMRFLKHLPVYRSKGTAAAAIRVFLKKLDAFRADPVQRLYFLYFNYYDWLQSKLAGLPYREYRRQQIIAPHA